MTLLKKIRSLIFPETFEIKNASQASKSRVKYLIAFSFVGFVLLWQTVAMIVVIFKPELHPFVPSPNETLIASFNLLSSGDYWLDIAITNYRVLLGFGLAVITAVPIGILLGTFPQLEGMSGPIMNFGRYIPVAAIVPLLIVWAGVGDLQKILVLYVGTFFQLLVLVTDSVRRVPLLYVDSAVTLGANTGKVLFKVILPAAMPQIYDSCRVSVGLTWSYILIAEIVASSQGIGSSIIRSQRYLQMDNIFVSIIILGILGLIYDRFFTYSRDLVFPWAIEERSSK